MEGNVKVSVFKPYHFEIGQKIHMEGGRRSGDWEVMDVTDTKVKLRCPFSLKEYEWDLFCYHVEDVIESEWPGKE